MSAEHQLEQLDLQGGWVQIPIERDELQPYITTMCQREVISLPTRRVTCIDNRQFLGRVAAKTGSATTAVNALLAYSRGQLSIAPCTACKQRYEDYGSAVPFPDCVFLPGKWKFACASCIARGNAVECSLAVPRQEYLNDTWERIDDPKKILGEDSQWLDRGHPLGRPECIWALRSECDGGREHDLTRPVQEPSFVHPSEIPGVRLPCRVLATAPSTPDRSPSARIAAKRRTAEATEKRRLRVESRQRRLAPRHLLVKDSRTGARAG